MALSAEDTMKAFGQAGELAKNSDKKTPLLPTPPKAPVRQKPDVSR
jgi:hypothetical protein